jgi:hypothetical protein
VKPQATLIFALVTLELDRATTFGPRAAYLLNGATSQTANGRIFVEWHVHLGFFWRGRQRRRRQAWRLNLRNFRSLRHLRQLELWRLGNRRQRGYTEELTAERAAGENNRGKWHAKGNEMA